MRHHALLALTAALAMLALLGGCPKPTPEPSASGPARGGAATTAASSDLSGKTALMVIAPKDFRDEEYFDVRTALEDAGATVKVASKTIVECTGMLGGEVLPDLLLADADPDDYDAVVFVGGGGAKVYFDDADAIALAQETDGADKVVAAICLAPVILANAGLLNGKMATVWPGERDALEAGSAVYTGEEATQDTNIVTGDGPEAVPAFSKLLIETIAKR